MSDNITPRCCDASKRSEVVRLRYSYEAIYKSEGQEGHTPQWEIDGHVVRFCPFCGQALPAVRRKAKPPKRLCRVSDGGYYCDTCGDRMDFCDCKPPEAAWEPVR